ncbi:MAG: hypothetical protein Q4B68_04440 [Bacteroidales bacterium]|nr:hypothetical protein [Bacteroidales bacterium]
MVSSTPIDLASVTSGTKAVLYNVDRGMLVGCTGGNNNTKATKTIESLTEYNAYVFTITKSNNALRLQNGNNYGPRVRRTGSGGSFSWSQNSITNISYTSSGTAYTLSATPLVTTYYLLLNDGGSVEAVSSSTDLGTKWQFFEVTEVSEPSITTPQNNSSVSLGKADRGETITKAISISAANLTQGLNISVEGAGFSVDRTSLTAAEANAGATVTVSFVQNVYSTYSGTLVITGENGMRVVVNLSAQVINPDIDTPTKIGQLTTWQVNAGEQMVGYVGLANQNEPLAKACVSLASAQIPEFTYRLYGNAQYIRAIRFYARERDAGYDYTPMATTPAWKTPSPTFSTTAIRRRTAAPFCWASPPWCPSRA